MSFRQGDRVRVKNPLSEYTGCRGTIVVDAADQPEGVHALGHFVAIDGENGRTRPFLVADLEALQVARVRRPDAQSQPTESQVTQSPGKGGGHRPKGL